MKIAVVGAGAVGTTLGDRLSKAGCSIRYGRQHPKDPQEHIPTVVRWAEVIILATPGQKEDAAIIHLAQSLGTGVAGKVLIDATNPFGGQHDLTIRWEQGTSAAEVLQQALPATNVYKAFNTTGIEHLAHPDGSRCTGQKLTMLFCGALEDEDTCARVVSLVGFIPVYCGHIRYARHLEALAELYVHLGTGDAGVNWSHHYGARHYHFQVLKRGLGSGASKEP